MLWATKQEVFDSSLANFDSVVYDTDKRLRDSKITFVSKKRKLPSYIFESGSIKSAVVKEVNIFKDILGISYLNLFQKKAFEKKSKNLIITGCVGSGKSLILIARLLYQFLTNSQQKLLLVVFNESKLAEYKLIFKKINLNCADISEKNFNQKMWRSRVGVVHCNTKRDYYQTQSFVDELSKNVAIYVDDAHASNIAISVSNCVCLAIDYNQSHLLHNQALRRNFHGFEIVALGQNYRSTWNIVSNLITLSRTIESKEKTQQNFMEHHPELSHHPSHGHLIHGPLTEIFIMGNDIQPLFHFFAKLIFLQVNNKLFSLQIFSINLPDNFPAPLAVLNELWGRAVHTNVTSSEQNIYSTEFGACVVLLVFSVMDTKMLRLLYNVYSRARSYCQIVVFLDEQHNPEALDEFLSIFKEAKIRNLLSEDELNFSNL